MSASGMGTGERGEASGMAGGFVVVCAFLAATIVSGKSAPARRSASFSGLVILRHLAVPAGSVVGSRALRMLLALVLNVPAGFERLREETEERGTGLWNACPNIGPKVLTVRYVD